MLRNPKRGKGRAGMKTPFRGGREGSEGGSRKGYKNSNKNKAFKITI
jgi:hypothetical protein